MTMKCDGVAEPGAEYNAEIDYEHRCAEYEYEYEYESQTSGTMPCVRRSSNA
jgi:hypothetical protein